MCGIVGIVNYNENISNQYPILRNMTQTLKKRGPDEEGLFFSKHVNLGHRRLNVIDIENGKQPMSFTYNEVTYTIVYNGQIYNTNELRKTLEENDFTFDTHSDTEVLLKSYIFYGNDVVKHLNGIFSFAIWNSSKEELFVARDHFGVKPFFYTIIDNSFIFASEIKALFEYPGVEKILDSQGISELFGIGPAHTPRYNYI